MPLVIQLNPIFAVLVQHLRQEDIFAAKLLAPIYRNPLPIAALCDYLSAQPGQAFRFEALLHLGYCLTDAGVPAMDVALVQPRNAGAPGIGLAQNPPHQLGYGALGSGVVEHYQQVSKRAVPALHQSGPGDNPAYRRKFGKQVIAG